MTLSKDPPGLAGRDEIHSAAFGERETELEDVAALVGLSVGESPVQVDRYLGSNTARGENWDRGTVEIVRRRAELAKRRNGDGRLFFGSEAIKEALLAIMGEQPHRETQQRVWRYIREMGGPDITEKQSMVDPSNQQSKKVVLEIDDDADDRFKEGRYVGLNLLADMNSRDVAQGGVTPVVTGVNA